MEQVKSRNEESAEENQAKLEMWGYALGFTPMAVLKCAVDLQIADIIETHGGAMSHSQLSAAAGCSPQFLRRIMRYLTHRRFFKRTTDPISYAQTPLSRLLLRNASGSIAPLLVLESSPAMIAPWHRLSSRASENGATPFEAEHGRSLWDYAAANPAHSKLLDEGMGCMARHSVAAIVDRYPEAFDGILSLVDVGGGDGSTLRDLVAAFPAIRRGINLDLPHVVSAALKRSDGDCDVIQHVAGDMFDAVPKADAAFLMRVLHDWSDEECIEILKKCKESVGRVIIAEAVIRDEDADEDEDEDEDEYGDVSLALDMVMLVHTERGRERNGKEWEFVVREAGFTTCTINHIHSIVSIIQAFP